MKRLKAVVAAKTLVAVAVAAISFALPSISHAGAAEGVTCPADHPPQFATGVLKCRMNTVQMRNSVCPPPLALDPNLADTCRVAGAPPGIPAVANSMAELVGTDLITAHDTPVRQVNNTQRDMFSVTFHDFVFPGGAFFVGNAQNGVKCPNGAQAVRSNDGRNLRCQKERENAICLGVYILKVRDGKDICAIEVNGSIINSQPTVPSGQLSSFGWTLDTNGPAGGSNRDQWVKFVDATAVGF
jgi:hypothetical protein